MIHLLYTLGLLVLVGVTLPWWVWQYFTTPKYRGTLRARLAHLEPATVEALARRPCFWVHAVSVGETIAAQGVVEGLHRRFPGLQVVVTTVTRTGQQVARERFPWVDRILYLPLDFPWVVERFVQDVGPRFVVVMETELWPNLFRALGRRGIPIVVANGRLSPNSHASYRKVAGAMRRLLAPVTRFAMQSSTDGERLASLGIEGERIRVTGNVKYDQALRPPAPEAWAELERRLPRPDFPVWLAASTHPGEEGAVVAAHRELRREFPGLRLILVPRHPERGGEVEQLVQRAGLGCQLFSRVEGVWGEEVLLVDRVGWLGRLYGYADAVFVGGSLIPHGGQNVLEPASLGIPPVCGPHTFNFREAVRQLREADGVVEIAAPPALAPAIRALLADPAVRGDMGQRAKGVVAANAGALERTLEAIVESVGPFLEGAIQPGAGSGGNDHARRP